jgi:hypothetical protein
MNTRLLMIAASFFLGLLGISLTFLPEELLQLYGYSAKTPLPQLLQLAGAAFLGFAMLNWTAKGQLFGGIYGRPIALGNFLHFFAGASALIKGYASEQSSLLYVAVMALYLLFAFFFGYMLFTTPRAVTRKSTQA